MIRRHALINRAGQGLQWLIQVGVLLTGKRVCWADVPWLVGPLGETTIGTQIYERYAADTGLELVLDDPEAGLLESFAGLGGATFDPAKVAPEIRDFYEHTARYEMDVWSQWNGILKPFANLLVYLVSPLMEQFNLPGSPLATSSGVSSEVIRLVDRQAGAQVYAGWLRKNMGSGEVIYAGFYTVCTPPGADGPCVKVVFPLPKGASTVILKPRNGKNGGFKLISHGRRFGDPGFYRIHRQDAARARVGYLPLKEVFDLYLGSHGTIRTDHTLYFLGRKFLTLRYRIRRTSAATEAP